MLNGIQSWVMQPFSEQMDLLHWFFFIIVVMSIIYLWNDVLRIAE